jgi:hypothetical protein
VVLWQEVEWQAVLVTLSIPVWVVAEALVEDFNLYRVGGCGKEYAEFR